MSRAAAVHLSRDEAVDDLHDLNEQESGTDRADDEPWSPGTMDAIPMTSDIYTGANRRLVDARDELQRMQQANAMIPDVVGGMLALADPAAADAVAAVMIKHIMEGGGCGLDEPREAIGSLFKITKYFESLVIHPAFTQPATS
eukprot:COSAG02_NODE_50_length_44860_cov_203.992739_6_plen_143_part_00